MIDESGPWLSSRNWQAKDRQEIIDWLLHSRKRGWDIILIAQAPSLIDKQVREAVIEAYARCRRLDRIKIPFTPFKLPRIHVAKARFGQDANAPAVQTWMYRGAVEHQCYQSYALFSTETGDGWYCTLPPRLTKWKNFVPWYKRIFYQPPPKPKPKPKLPEVEALMGLDPDHRVKAWHHAVGHPAPLSVEVLYGMSPDERAKVWQERFGLSGAPMLAM